MSAATASSASATEGLQSQPRLRRHFSAAIPLHANDPAATPPRDPAPADLPATPAAARRRSLQDRAWDLACQGLRAPAIADAVGVPERTVRSWLAAIRREVAADLREDHAEQLLLAVESIRHV